MRITRRQIRRVIRESLLTEGGMKERFGEITDAVDFILTGQPGTSGDALAAAVQKELEDYGMADPKLAIDKQEVFDVLDILIEEGDVFFDIEEDKWYMAKSPEGLRAQQAMVNRA